MRFVADEGGHDFTVGLPTRRCRSHFQVSGRPVELRHGLQAGQIFASSLRAAIRMEISIGSEFTGLKDWQEIKPP
jgi:hypothetical protein